MWNACILCQPIIIRNSHFWKFSCYHRGHYQCTNNPQFAPCSGLSTTSTSLPCKPATFAGAQATEEQRLKVIACGQQTSSNPIKAQHLACGRRPLSQAGVHIVHWMPEADTAQTINTCT